MDKLIKKNEYRIFLETLKTGIISARQKAYQIVNQRLAELYLYIGKSIYEEIEVSKWGEGVVETLAEDLQREFPDMKGFSAQNLWRMKELYETYKDNEKLSPLVRELSWTHYRRLIRVENDKARNFYLNECADAHWSTRQLER